MLHTIVEEGLVRGVVRDRTGNFEALARTVQKYFARGDVRRSAASGVRRLREGGAGSTPRQKGR